jgi:hypothetical protein
VHLLPSFFLVWRKCVAEAQLLASSSNTPCMKGQLAHDPIDLLSILKPAFRVQRHSRLSAWFRSSVSSPSRLPASVPHNMDTISTRSLRWALSLLLAVWSILVVAQNDDSDVKAIPLRTHSLQSVGPLPQCPRQTSQCTNISSNSPSSTPKCNPAGSTLEALP